ncbi:MAG TPA: CRISPR system precrRNA processing endoribonuclease RAMP protein Cas6 [Pyrinomonadaceae bacterium]|nr:CRISPR system precrRNA processing endoribonuclease RAMP protein Cas6 [Pyrinomonadaceae bacterium]
MEDQHVALDPLTMVCLTLEHLKALSLAQYEFRLAALTEGELPPFLGSTFRGSFGYALKAVACSMPHQDCTRCLLVERCLYPRLFEPRATQPAGLLKQQQNAPRPFIFEPPLPGQKYSALPFNAEIRRGPATDGKSNGQKRLFAEPLRFKAGDELRFGLTLIGSAIEELPYIVYAISLMARHGFGAQRTPFALLAVSAVDGATTRLKIYTPEMAHIEPHDVCRNLSEMVKDRLAQLVPTDTLRLLFLTPMRIRVQKGVQERLHFEQLVKSLSLRLTMLAQTYSAISLDYDYQALLAQARTAITQTESLWQQELKRYSNRQDKKIEQDGFMGEAVFAGQAVSDLLPLLVAGEFLHVGSGTAFGLGRYHIAA